MVSFEACAASTISEKSSSNSISDYKYIMIEDTCSLDGELNADLSLDYASTLKIPQGKNFILNGDITLSNNTLLETNGHFTVKGDIKTNITISDYINLKIGDQGILEIKGAMTSVYSVFNLTGGTVIISGDKPQNIHLSSADTVIIENTSEAGVTFTTNLSVTRLFDHKGNNFNLFYSGNYSTFVNFDGDTILDHLDPAPTVFDKKFYYNKVCNVNVDNETDIKDLVRIKKMLATNSTDSIYDIDKDASLSANDMLIVRKVLLNDYSFHK